MWQGKHKAITFSFDDGVTQDVDLVKIFNDYGIKATFNLNSGLFGACWKVDVDGRAIPHDKIFPDQVKDLYSGHEVAVHTVNHPRLTKIADEKIVWEVEEDRKSLEKLVGYDIVGMAYPGGGYDDRVVGLLNAKTKMRYARHTISSYNFKPQTDLLRFAPTVHFLEKDEMYRLAKLFMETEAEEDQIFYIWGHAYELDANGAMDWREIERFCKYVSNKKDIFYGTNKQVLLNEQ